MPTFGGHSKYFTKRSRIAKKIGFCLEFRGDELKLKRNHHYYYQIQGQLNISRRNICYFVVYIDDNHPIFVEEIVKDEILWKVEMFPTLTKFYEDCIEELIRKRLSRNQRCYDPPYILEAQNKNKSKK